MTPKSHWLQNSLYCAIAVMAFGLSQPSQAQGFVMPATDYIKDQIADKGHFFKDDSIWTYTEAFAKQFGMPPEGVSPELQGLEAVAFRVERNHIDQCGMGGSANACIPNAFCMLDLYIDEAKHPLPWREPSQLSGWGGWYSSLFFIKRYETIEGVSNRSGGGIGTLEPFVDSTGTKLLSVFVKADRNIQNPGQWGEAAYTLANLGFRRHIDKKLSIVTTRAPCMESQEGPNSRYLFISERYQYAGPLPSPRFAATWSSAFATRMNDLKASAGRQFINSVKSAVPVLAPILEGAKK